MRFYYVDLKPYFIKCNISPQNEYSAFSEEDFRFGETEKDGIIFNFERNVWKYDSIECNNQIVDIPDVPCDEIIIAGKCDGWYYAEKFKLLFSDGSTDYATAKFFDFSINAKPGIDVLLDSECEYMRDFNHVLLKCKRGGTNDNYSYMYYYKTTLKVKGRRLNQIIFPDNILMDIFAITLIRGDNYD